MKPQDSLTLIFRHHLWANLRLVEFCAGLEQEQLAASATGTRGTIHETLEHIASAERSYVSRITTGQPASRPDQAAPMSLSEISNSLRATGEKLIEWASRVGPEDSVEVNWDGAPRAVPTNIIMTQMLHHGGEHREQVKAILTGLGLEPPDLQAWEYFDQLDK